MKLETDPRRVEQLAEQREDENWLFRSFLKGVHLEIEEIDAIAHRLYETVSSQIDCRACGNCCRKVLPTLSRAEVIRLASGLGLSKVELIRRYLQPAREKNTFSFNATPCPLLSGNLCTAYASRPDDCGSFPHLHKPEFVFRLMQVVEDCSICPIVFNVLELLKGELWHEEAEATYD